MKKILLSLFVIFLNCFSQKIYAQENIITPGEPNVKIEDRILKIEKAVRDLQEKNYNIPSVTASQNSQTAPPPKGAKYLCEINVLGKYFYAYGKSKLDTKAEVSKKCQDGYINDVHCINSDCKELK